MNNSLSVIKMYIGGWPRRWWTLRFFSYSFPFWICLLLVGLSVFPGWAQSSVTVNTPANQSFCVGSTTAPIVFSGANSRATTYRWTNNNPAIGLATSGTGSIPSFSAQNATNAPLSATITVTPEQPAYAYVPNISASSVSVINTVTNQLVTTIRVNTNPVGVAISPDGSRVYVTNVGSDNVSVINTVTNQVVATIGVNSNPAGVAISPDGSRIYVANSFSNNVSVINTATNQVIATVNVDGTPIGTSITPDGSRLYVTNFGVSTVSVINTATNQVVSTINVGTSPYGLSISPDGSRVYVPNGNSNTVSVINTATNQVLATIAVANHPSFVSVSPDGSRIYVVGDNVSVINTATNQVVVTIAVGDYPFGASLTPDGSRLYVPNRNSNNVSVINTATNQVITTISIESGPNAFGNFVGPDGGGGQAQTFTITVNPLPNAGFTGLNSTYCANAGAVTLTPTTSGGTFSGPGVSATTFTPTNAGTSGTVSYSVSINGCTNTSSQNVVVNALPNAAFSGLGSTYCANSGAVTLSPTTSGGTFSGPGVSGTTFTPANAGTGGAITYSVTVNGCVNSSSQTVTVNPLPNAGFTGLSSPYCANAGAVTLTPTTAGGTFSGSGISGTTFTPANAQSGGSITYSVTVNGCSNTSSQNVTVNPLPNATFSGLASSYCANAGAVTLTPTTAGGTFSGPGVSGTTFTPANAGTGKTVSYNVSINGCTNTSSQNVVVNALPNAAFSGLSGAAYCANAGAVTLTPTVSGGTFSGLGVSGTTFTPANAGTGGTVSYSLTVNGCVNSSSQTVTVNALPNATLSNNGPLSDNNPTVILTAGGGNSYGFSSGASQQGGGNTATVTSPGIFQVTVTANGCTATASTTLTGGAGQTICRNGTAVVNVAASGNPIRYEWYRNGTNTVRMMDIPNFQRGTSTASLTLINQQTTASYYVRVTDANGSSVVYGPIKVTVNTACNANARLGAEEVALRITLLGNPLQGEQLRAIISGAAGKALHVQLLDLRGQVLGQQVWQEAQSEQLVEWPMGNQASGMYVLRAATPTQAQSVKLIKE